MQKIAVVKVTACAHCPNGELSVPQFGKIEDSTCWCSELKKMVEYGKIDESCPLGDLK